MMIAPHDVQRRLQRIERTIANQKTFMLRVPDPDNRGLAEINLLTLVSMKQDVEHQQTRVDAES